jgi:hypothetical protein
MKRTSSHVSRIIAVLILACLAFLITCSSNHSDNHRQAAEYGLITLRNMAQDSEFHFYGYESASDVGKEELGDPIEVKTIDLDALIESGVPGDYMIIEKNEYLFPVMVREKPIGSIQIMIDEGKWEYVATKSKAGIEKALEIISANSLDPDNCYLLDLEEIELVFVGYESNGRNILIPLFKNESCPFVPGTKYEFTKIANDIKSEILFARDSYNNMVPSDSNDLNEQRASKIKELPGYNSSPKPVREYDSKTNNFLNIKLIPQMQNQWCWAATGLMTMLFAGGEPSAITQCAQANDAFSQDSCCTDGGTKECNKPYRPLYSNWGFTAKKIFNPEGAGLSWTALKGLIDNGKPVAFLWRWKKGGGHYMVAVGYYEDLTTNPVTRMVHINNPWPPDVGEQQSVTYDKWIGGPDFNNLQTCYFYDIAKN